jgi:NDP-sugar pyrophosphorylase family protein
MINIVIPMAGMGSRFAEVGYKDPKPFIPVKGKMMIERVLDNLHYKDAKFILIARKEHIQNRADDIKKIQDKYNVIFESVDRLTDGAACTVLKSHYHINNEHPLLIANSDQIVDISIADFIDDCLKRKLDGSILTFPSNHPKWSYAKIDAQNLVTEVREKVVISKNATVGIYFFSKGKYFVDGALDMIASGDKVNHEYYVCPVYNHLIKKNKKIGIFDIEESKMHGTGTPEDLRIYEQLI